MRKLLALVLVALLAMTLAVALIGCGGQQTETAAPEGTEMPPADTSMPADTGMGMAPDTTMSH